MASGLYWWDAWWLPRHRCVETPLGVTDSPDRIVSPGCEVGMPSHVRSPIRHRDSQDLGHREEECTMGSNMDDLKGRVKEGVGAATDDKDLEREGKMDRAGGAVKDAAEKAKDKVADGVDAVKDKLNDRR
jgi:uncharacterized protein YjbJ (UPF0337 family)